MHLTPLASLLSLLALACAAQSGTAGSPKEAHGPAGPPRAQVAATEVRALTRATLLIDTHNETPGKTVDGLDIAKPRLMRQVEAVARQEQ